MSTPGGLLSSGELRARCPRSLLDMGSDPLPEAGVDGLIPVALTWSDSRITSLKPASEASGLVLPRLVEPHAHFDKAFSWTEHPNLQGTYEQALAANFRELSLIHI